MTYNWEITSLYKKDINEFIDVITTIQFKLIATTEDNVIASYNGNIVLDIANLGQESFIPLNELDNVTLLNWLENSVKSNQIYWNHINEFIDNIIRLNRNIDLGSMITDSI